MDIEITQNNLVNQLSDRSFDQRQINPVVKEILKNDTVKIEELKGVLKNSEFNALSLKAVVENYGWRINAENDECSLVKERLPDILLQPDLDGVVRARSLSVLIPDDENVTLIPEKVLNILKRSLKSPSEGDSEQDKIFLELTTTRAMRTIKAFVDYGVRDYQDFQLSFIKELFDSALVNQPSWQHFGDKSGLAGISGLALKLAKDVLKENPDGPLSGICKDFFRQIISGKSDNPNYQKDKLNITFLTRLVEN